MVGTEDVDHVVEAAQHLVAVIGDVGGEIRVGSIGLDERPIGVVAVVGGAEQGLLAVFPILGCLALRWFQPALIDHALLAQPGESRGDVAVRAMKGPFGEEHVVVDVELGEVGADEVHHRLEHPVLDQRQRLVL
jgi:hypothetical protein